MSVSFNGTNYYSLIYIISVSAGYAFVDFGSAINAQRALNTFNGSLIPNTHKQFKLNWASGGGLIDRR